MCIHCAGTAPAEATEASGIAHQKQIKTWDARMTTLEGEFVIASQSIEWLIRFMMSGSPDAETDAVIRAAVLKALSDAAHVKATRQFVADHMPHRKQRASVVSIHLEQQLPRLQADIDSIRCVVTAVNQEQTEKLGSMLDGHTTTILQRTTILHWGMKDNDVANSKPQPAKFVM